MSVYGVTSSLTENTEKLFFSSAVSIIVSVAGFSSDSAVSVVSSAGASAVSAAPGSVCGSAGCSTSLSASEDSAGAVTDSSVSAGSAIGSISSAFSGTKVACPDSDHMMPSLDAWT